MLDSILFILLGGVLLGGDAGSGAGVRVVAHRVSGRAGERELEICSEICEKGLNPEESKRKYLGFSGISSDFSADLIRFFLGLLRT